MLDWVFCAFIVALFLAEFDIDRDRLCLRCLAFQDEADLGCCLVWLSGESGGSWERRRLREVPGKLEIGPEVGCGPGWGGGSFCLLSKEMLTVLQYVISLFSQWQLEIFLASLVLHLL